MGLLGVLLVIGGIRSGTAPDVGVVLLGLVFLVAAGYGGWRYAQGQLPVGVQRPLPEPPVPTVSPEEPLDAPLPPEEGIDSAPPEAH